MHSPECRWLYLLPGVEQFLNPQLRCAGLIDLQSSEMGVTESHGLGGAAHLAAGLQEDLDAALWSSAVGLPGGGRVAVQQPSAHTLFLAGENPLGSLEVISNVRRVSSV